MEAKKKDIVVRFLVTFWSVVFLILFIWLLPEKKGRTVIFPEEWSEVKTNDSLIVIYADDKKIELGFNNKRNR